MINESTCDRNLPLLEFDTLQAANGCDSIVTINRILLPVPAADFSYSMGENGEVIFHNASSDAEAYSWSFGDDSTSAEENPSHLYEAGASYEVSLIAYNLCGSDTAAQTIDVLPSGLVSARTKTLNIYPNPNKGKFEVDVPAGLKSFDLSIINAWGQLVYSRSYTGRTNKIDINIDLPGGLFCVMLRNGNEVFRTSVVSVE
jgi:PKD repeat protein